jgi:hypothetical protein
VGMISKRYREEFERDGIEAVRKQVELDSYTDSEKHRQAVAWLNAQNPARKSYRVARKQLTLSRRTARETRIAVILAALILIAVAILIFAVIGGLTKP